MPDRRATLSIDTRIPRLTNAVEAVVRGKPEVVRQSVITLLAGGHLLIEDVPGVGKTTLGRALARSMGGEFQRVQFTSDLLPSDILGVNVLDPQSREFRFRPGPVFAHVLLADEINRTTPRTQSALLQAMEEHQVTLDGTTHALPDPFFVIATQNPLEHHGTYPLPESQMDRFLMRVSMGYPERGAEKELIGDRDQASRIDAVEPVIDPEAIVEARREVANIRLDDSVIDYMLRIVEATRVHPDLSLGASPRASLSLGRAARAAAYLAGRTFVVPDDVKPLIEPLLAHRLMPRDQGVGPAADRETVRGALTDLVGRTPVPL
jgi:MoxR-like ATPase